MKFNIKKAFNNCKFQAKKNKGLIFTCIAGISTIVAVITTAKQAPKAQQALKDANEKIGQLKLQMNDTEAILNKKVDIAVNKKEIKKIQRQTAIKLVKIYAVPAIFTGLSLTFMGTSYKVMKDKEIALSAAYITAENAFKTYRDKVKEKFGEEAEKDIYNDVRNLKKTRKVENPVTGEIEEVEESINKVNTGNGWSILFDAASPYWSKNGRVNYETLLNLQKDANIQLRSDGYIFLYDIIQMLKIPESCIDRDLLTASRVIGWVDDPFDPNRNSWVSFGISDETNHYNEVGKELFDNVERDVWLRFNPDGNIALNNTFTFFSKK